MPIINLKNLIEIPLSKAEELKKLLILKANELIGFVNIFESIFFFLGNDL